MNDQQAAQWHFDDALAKGQRVVVRWTSSGRHFSGPAKISKINEKSVLAELEVAVGPYPAGRQISAPRFLSASWSANNRVEPHPVPCYADLVAYAETLHPCKYGHPDCAIRDRGPCVDEHVCSRCRR